MPVPGRSPNATATLPSVGQRHGGGGSEGIGGNFRLVELPLLLAGACDLAGCAVIPGGNVSRSTWPG